MLWVLFLAMVMQMSTLFALAAMLNYLFYIIQTMRHLQPMLAEVLQPTSNLCFHNLPMAMDEAAKKAISKLMAQDLPINTKWQQIRSTLLQAGHIYQATLSPNSFLIHPSNRGGAMVSWHDCHEKGAKILATGPDFGKISMAVAMELAIEPQAKEKQVAANQVLCQASQNQLPMPNGHERFLTLGCSHLTMFCKAVMASCQTNHEDLRSMRQGQLSMDACCKGQGDKATFHKMCHQGWQWDIVQAIVEQEFPSLPLLIQQALNSDHVVASSGNEVEVMQSIAHHFQYCRDLQAAVASAIATRPSCMPYMAAISNFVQNFSGGPSFPIVKLLAHISVMVCLGIFAFSKIFNL